MGSKHCYMEQVPTDGFPLKVNLHIHAVAFTYFDNYDDFYNPWRLWEEHIKDSIGMDLKMLNSKKYKKNPTYFAYDEEFYHKTIHNRMYGTLIVAIYSEVERFLKQILKLENFNYSCFNCKIKQLNLNKNNLQYSKEINILRLKANAFKHNDMKMNKELAKILKEKEGTIIDYTIIDIKNLLEQCCEFLWSIEEAVGKGKNATK